MALAALLTQTSLAAAAALAALAGLVALVFGWDAGSADSREETARELAARIEDLLPQTQCGQCGHPGCRPYAQAVAVGEAFNKCPPGGLVAIAAIADLLGAEPRALDPEHGREGPRLVARIREDECIGCTRCLPACPVDAILGAPRQMHTVIADECTGCDLCVEPCPVDCIEMLPMPAPDPSVAADHRILAETP